MLIFVFKEGTTIIMLLIKTHLESCDDPLWNPVLNAYRVVLGTKLFACHQTLLTCFDVVKIDRSALCSCDH